MYGCQLVDLLVLHPLRIQRPPWRHFELAHVRKFSLGLLWAARALAAILPGGLRLGIRRGGLILAIRGNDARELGREPLHADADGVLEPASRGRGLHPVQPRRLLQAQAVSGEPGICSGGAGLARAKPRAYARSQRCCRRPLQRQLPLKGLAALALHGVDDGKLTPAARHTTWRRVPRRILMVARRVAADRPRKTHLGGTAHRHLRHCDRAVGEWFGEWLTCGHPTKWQGVDLLLVDELAQLAAGVAGAALVADAVLEARPPQLVAYAARLLWIHPHRSSDEWRRLHAHASASSAGAVR
mmetsp:Transcript_68663/g.223437  ORF Transcript_68663/g.223437 Transcript_68663/m.223437 type:complete len:299 (+) Transcript_68663:1659-2555(+)